VPIVTRSSTPKQSSDVLSRLISLEDIEDDGIKMLIYGHSGTGKTRLAATFSVLGPTLHIICSSNKLNEARSIRGHKNIKIVDLKQPDDLSALVAHAKNHKYKTVILDHVTEFCNIVLAKIMKLEKMPEQSSWGLAKQQDYAQMGLQVKEYLRELLDLPCNVLILGQQRSYDTVTDDDGTILIPFVSVAATPAVAGWLTPACDYVVQTFKSRTESVVVKKIGNKEIKTKEKSKEVAYLIRVGPSETYMTKFRVPIGVKLPLVIEDPSYDKLKYLF